MKTINIKNRLLETGKFINNKYLDLYCQLIQDNTTKNREPFITERHHIIPKCHFKYVGEAVDNSANNIINLDFRDHIFAHYYMSLCALEPLNNLNALAVMEMLGRKSRPYTEEEINELLPELELLRSNWRSYTSLRLKGRKVSSETIEKRLKTRQGFKHSEETKIKISQSNKQFYEQMSESDKVLRKTKRKITLNNNPCHWFTDGISNKQFHEDDIIPEGFVRGRTISSEHRSNLCKAQQERFKHCFGTMLGKHFSEEQLERLSKSHIGVRQSDYSKEKISKKMAGSKIYTNGQINVRVFEGETPPEGFIRGRCRKNQLNVAEDILGIEGNTNLEEI